MSNLDHGSLEHLHAALPDAILEHGWWGDQTMADPAWRAAFDAVPRHRFAPDAWYEWNGDGTWTTRHRRDEDAWARAVYATDQPMITQVDPDTGKPSCSLSAPFLVAAMLGALQLEPGHNVLESGTGCGWTAALMGAYLHDTGSITSLEYDEALAATARENIDRVVGNTFVRAGDGQAGWSLRAPYDRLSATHAVWRIPKAWISQTRPGGLLCAPLAVSENGLDVFVRLTAHGDGSASGPVLFPLAFMRSRSETREPDAGWASDEARAGTTSLDLPAILADENAWVLRLAVPGIAITGPAVEDGDDCVWLSLPDGSWAVGYVPSGKPWEDVTVEQHGPVDVWTLAEAAWAAWEAAGRPGMDEYGLTVLPGGEHRLWCREPGNVVSVLP